MWSDTSALEHEAHNAILRIQNQISCNQRVAGGLQPSGSIGSKKPHSPFRVCISLSMPSPVCRRFQLYRDSVWGPVPMILESGTKLNALGLIIYIKMKKENLKILGINVKKNLTINQLLTLSSEDLLCRENAEKIAVLRELCEEFYYTKTRKTKTVSSPESAAKLFAGKLKYLDREECWIATLDSANGVIGVERISVGNLNSCIFDIKRIVRTCLTHNANSMIVAHNHPSGNVKPSSSDIKQTEQLRDALKLFDIGLIDHIILSDREYFSFSNEMSEKYE